MMALASTAHIRVRAVCRCRHLPRMAPLWAVRETARWLTDRGIDLPSTMALVVWQCPRCHHRTTLTVGDLFLGATPV